MFNKSNIYKVFVYSDDSWFLQVPLFQCLIINHFYKIYINGVTRLNVDVNHSVGILENSDWSVNSLL